MLSTKVLKPSFFAALLVLLLQSSLNAQANTSGWLGAEFEGRDLVSGQACSVQIDQKIDESFFGDRIYLTVTLGGSQDQVVVTNHPIFGGRVFGKNLYQYSTEKNEQGVVVGITDEYWVEAEVSADSEQLRFINRHLGKKQGGLMIGSPKGTLTQCEMTQKN